MIYECLIAPHEFSNSITDIKYALLTYDKVNIIHPEDRDLMPENMFMNAISGIPLGINMGPICPMGKSMNYDDNFQNLIDECKPAIEQGLLKVIKTFNLSVQERNTLGGIPNGGYPLNTSAIFAIFRSMAQDQSFLNSSVKSNLNMLLSAMDIEDGISLKGHGNARINNQPELPLLDIVGLSLTQKKYLTHIARARVAAFIKYSGYCEMKNLIPLFESDIYGNLLISLLQNVKTVLVNQAVDLSWTKRNWVSELCHDEFINKSILKELSIKDVIRLRSKMWGKQASAREALFESIYMISKEVEDETNFVTRAKNSIKAYKKIAEDLEYERKKLEFKISCDIATLCLGGFSTQIQSPIKSIGATLVVGGIWAINKVKEYGPQLMDLKKQEESFKRGAGFGIVDFYQKKRFSK